MKILIIHATAGAGHKKAAEALFNGLRDHKAFDVHFVDALDYTSPFYKKTYRETYTFLVGKVPWLWGAIFHLIDIPILLPVVRLFRRLNNVIHAQRLHKFLISEKFDTIVSTHFFPSEVACALKRKGAINPKIITVVTDFDVHSIWLAEGTEIYCVATEWTKGKVKRLGVSEHRALISGIPTDAKFSESRDKDAMKDKLALRKDVFTVLVATGSFGFGPIEEIIDELQDIQVLVVCGHNQNLYRRLRDKNYKLANIYGLVDNMDELMCVSDCMITKPGGLSISEALVSRLPLIFFNAIPGQEEGNIRVLKQHGVGVSDCSIKQIASHVKQYQSSQEDYNTAVSNVEKLASPTAVDKIISIIS